MGNYSKNRLRLVSQGITGGRIWYYDDTGAIGTIAEAAGFFSNAGDMGVERGDLVFVRASSGTGAIISGHGVVSISDTGASQGTIGAATTVADTS